ncbi:uncharacterized protein LOC143589375 [Bidens hawaiensis]|uniref:uncharacterized protein LOC143589375 n=1 Tax=Bidens hawaiensis TaxID=980011 RepID=UPI00404905B8
MEKLVMALVYASRRLHGYFHGYTINVLTNYKIQNVLQKPELSGRLAKWAIELGEHTIQYRSMTAIKGQVMADFIAKIPSENEEECRAEEKPTMPIDENKTLLFTDGASNDEGSGAELKLISPRKQEFTYTIRLDFKSSNNEAKYEAFLAGLRIANKFGAQYEEAHIDSMLVANQVNGSYEAKDEAMASYLEQVRQLIQKFKSCKVKHIKRSENKLTDAVSKLVATSFNHLAKEVIVETLAEPSVTPSQVCITQNAEESWMTPIKAYLTEGLLSQGKVKAQKIRHKFLQYEMKEGILYTRSFLGPLLCCVDADDATYLIREIQEGICDVLQNT